MSVRKDGPRPTVIGTCSLSPHQGASAEEILADSLAMIDQMAREAERKGWELDITILPEHSAPFADGTAEQVAERIDGRTITAMAEKARQHHTYIAAPVHLRQDDQVFNSIVMLDRNGRPLGTYHKVFPVTMTDGSLEHGVTPGRDFPGFDLEFGRVGVQICWDIAFPEGWQALGDQETELVLYATDPIGLLGLKSHAWQHNYYIAGATHRPPAAVIDPTGHVIATTSADREVLVVRVDLDYRVLNSNCLWTWPESRRTECADRIKLEWREEAWLYLVTSLDAGMPVRRFMEMEGLLTGRERRARNLALLTEARGGPPEMPNVARHA
jgi:predicted amidohydrolase